MEFLSTKFVEEYVSKHPKPLTEIGEFVFYRTYSRWLNDKGRREYWHETVKRAIEYNMALAYRRLIEIGYKVDLKEMRDEARELFKNIYHTKQFPSGRTLWLGNANPTVNKDFALGNFNCFTRDTEFITDKGIRSFHNFKDGEEIKVLNASGKFADATVKKFGKEKIYELTVKKGRRTEIFKTTANHRWYAKNAPSYHKFDIRTTLELKNGDVLRTKKRYEFTDVVPSSIGIQHGIVYGDGTYDKNKNHCRVHLVDEKRELKKYFTDGSVTTAGGYNQTVIYGLPNNWKELPSVDMNAEYLMGFLMGLFATDGSNSGNQHTISNADENVLKAIKDYCAILGINTSNIRMTRELNPYNDEYSPLYEITLSVYDINEDFLIRTRHKENFIKPSKKEKDSWKVVSVKDTGEYEDVWCVQEPETESFTLHNGILTKNCSFLNISSWKDLGDLFYLLMVGCGVGLKSTKKMASKMNKIRVNTTLLHSEYKPVAPEQRLENTKVVIMENGFAKIYVGDSKNGWVDALRDYFRLLTEEKYESIHTVKISYNSVRPRGERLKTFGGTASGHQPLKEMFEGIDKVLKNQIDPHLKPIEMDEKGYGQVRPVHILDIANLIGANVVVGGVRRTSEVFLFDKDDYESMLAKYGINGFWKEEHFQQHEKVRELLIKNDIDIPAWFDEIGVRNYDESINGDKPFNFGRAGVNHRRMSNNSVAFMQKPSREQHALQFALLRGEGEPCFINLEEGARRVAKAIGYKNPSRKILEAIMVEIGLNPCVEILLFSYNVCNLTTINVTQFIKSVNGKYELDLEGLLNAQRLSARIGLRMTLTTLELPHWDKTQRRDSLIGTSLTGWKDAMAILGYTQEQEEEVKRLLKYASRDEADSYAKFLRVPSPLLATTVKPEGTLSQVAKNPITNSPVSSGLHMSHAPFFIRRIRINSNDPLVKVAQELGWIIHAEVGTANTNGIMYIGEDELASPEAIENARTLVISFPVASGATKTKDDVTVEEQFQTYFSFMKNYVEHNASNTIDIKEANGEWEKAEQIVWDNWDDFVGVSFLASDGGTYKLAPYETISEEQYHEMRAKIRPFDPKLLRKYEQSETAQNLEGMESCSSGVCPIV